MRGPGIIGEGSELVSISLRKNVKMSRITTKRIYREEKKKLFN